MRTFVVAVSLLGLAGCASLSSPTGPYGTVASERSQVETADADQTALKSDQAVDAQEVGAVDANGAAASATEATNDKGGFTAFFADVANSVFGEDEVKPEPLAHSEDMVGAWAVHLASDERVCQLDLGTEPKSTGFQAKATNCMDGDLFFVSNWGMRDQELLLLDDLSQVKGTMRLTEQNRWEGELASDGKVISIARVEDELK